MDTRIIINKLEAKNIRDLLDKFMEKDVKLAEIIIKDDKVVGLMVPVN